MKFLISIILFILLILPNIHAKDNQDLININFKDLNIMELIKITSEKINKNILVTKNIDANVDFMSNKPIKKENLLSILEFSLEDNGYKLVKSGDIYRIIKNDKKENPKKLIEENKFLSKSNQNVSEVIFLSNVEVGSLEKILNTIIDKRDYNNRNKPSIAIDEKSNSIILDGEKDEITNIKNIISKLDVIESQVFVKANIVEIDDNLLENIGIKFGILGGSVHSGNINTFASNLNAGEAISIDTSSIGLEIPNVSSSLALAASISLLNKTYALNIISQPSILCLNNNESSIYVGETISIQTGTTTTDGGNTTNSFSREDVGLTLKVKPRIGTKNKVRLEINTILEGIKNTSSSNLNPDTSKKEVNTIAIVNNGESVIIGGLIENKSENTIEKVPFISDIPLIGELFKNRLNNTLNKNLVVIVTPYIIPKNKDLSFVRSELSKLKSLEDKFLEEALLKLKSKKQNFLKKEEKEEDLKKELEHKQRVKEYFGR